MKIQDLFNKKIDPLRNVGDGIKINTQQDSNGEDGIFKLEKKLQQYTDLINQDIRLQTRIMKQNLFKPEEDTLNTENPYGLPPHTYRWLHRFFEQIDNISKNINQM